MTNRVLGRAELLSRNHRRYTQESVLGFGELRLRNLTAAEMRGFRRFLQTPAGEVDAERGARLQELLIADTMVDEEDNLQFSREDALSGVFDNVDGALINRCFQLAKEWTGFSIDEDFSALEQAIKNSNNGQASATPAA